MPISITQTVRFCLWLVPKWPTYNWFLVAINIKTPRIISGSLRTAHAGFQVAKWVADVDSLYPEDPLPFGLSGDQSDISNE